MPSRVCASPAECGAPQSRSPPPLRGLSLAPLAASRELTVDTKLLKHGLLSPEGGGGVLVSVEAGDPCRLGGEELSRLAVSESL